MFWNKSWQQEGAWFYNTQLHLFFLSTLCEQFLHKTLDACVLKKVTNKHLTIAACIFENGKFLWWDQFWRHFAFVVHFSIWKLTTVNMFVKNHRNKIALWSFQSDCSYWLSLEMTRIWTTLESSQGMSKHILNNAVIFFFWENDLSRLSHGPLLWLKTW